MSSSPARRAPLQARSAETVQAVLDAASGLLARLPFEQVTTSRIAEEAGLSIGALYRFYNDKQEIFDAIAVRELDRFRAQIAESVKARHLVFTPRKSLERILDAYVAFLDASPHFRVLALGRHISDRVREGQSNPETGPGGILRDLLVDKLGVNPGRRLGLKIRLAAEVGDRVIAFAYGQPSRAERDEVLGELKELLAKYLL